MRNETESEVVQDIITENWIFTNLEPHIVGWKMTKKKPSWVRDLVDWQKHEQNVDRSVLNKLISKAADEDVSEHKDNINKKDSNEEYNLSDIDNNESEKSTSQSNSNSSSINSESESLISSSSDNQNSEHEKDLNANDDDIQQKVTNNIFKNVFSGNFKSKMAERTKITSQSYSSDPIDIYITGPIRNTKTFKSHWVVVYGGGNGGAYMVKSGFIRDYISTVMDGVQGSIIDPDHCNTYNDILRSCDELQSIGHNYE